MIVDEKIKVATVIGATGYVYGPFDSTNPSAPRPLYSTRRFSNHGQALAWHREFMDAQRNRVPA